MPLLLAQNTIHLWSMHLPEWDSAMLARAREQLPAGEREQMARYRIPEDAARFCIGRTMLRYLSAAYLGVDGAGLSLKARDHGKPYWEGREELHFNLSHSGAWVLLAFSATHEVGVDVQHTEKSRRLDHMNVARQACHPEELEALLVLPETKRKALFYRIWSCKEAVIKAAGQGLHGQLQTFSVVPLPEGEAWRPVTTDIRLRQLRVDGEHMAALATQGTVADPVIERRDFGDSGWLETRG